MKSLQFIIYFLELTLKSLSNCGLMHDFDKGKLATLLGQP